MLICDGLPALALNFGHYRVIMNLVWGQVKFWLLWVLVNTFALGVALLL